MKRNFKLVAAMLMAVMAVAFASCKKDDPDPTPSEPTFDKCELNIDLTTDTVNCAELRDMVQLAYGDTASTPFGVNMIGDEGFRSKIGVALNGDTTYYDIPVASPTTFKKTITFTELPADVKVWMEVDMVPIKGVQDYDYSFFYHANVSYDLLATDGTVLDGGHRSSATTNAAGYMDRYNAYNYLQTVCPVLLADFDIQK